MTEKRENGPAKGGMTTGKLDAKLLAYCAAASGALLAAPPAEAAVVYSGVKNQVINVGNSVSVDLDNDGIKDMQFIGSTFNSYSNFSHPPYFRVKPLNNNSAAWNGGSIYNIAAGASINANLNWQHHAGILNKAVFQPNKFPPFYGKGPFANTTGYIGVRFTIGGQKHYGWVQYHGVIAFPSWSGTIIDWAYESTADYSIQAGQTTGSGQPVTSTTTTVPTTSTTTITTTTTTAAPIDTDGDGIPDALDNCPAVYNPLQLDANTNGTGDCCDPAPGCGGCGQPACDTACDGDGDGVPNDIDNCPAVYNPLQLDANTNGIGDCCDPAPGCGGCGQPACDTACAP